MAIREIVKEGSELLRKRSSEVAEFNEELWTLLDDMVETMRNASGAGLAAVQVGVLKRVFITDVGEGLTEFINPEILKCSGSNISSEGCLSIPNKNAIIERPEKVKVRAKNRLGKTFVLNVRDYAARAVCHEYDHLEGRLYVDLIVPELQTKAEE